MAEPIQDRPFEGFDGSHGGVTGREGTVRPGGWTGEADIGQGDHKNGELTVVTVRGEQRVRAALSLT